MGQQLQHSNNHLLFQWCSLYVEVAVIACTLHAIAHSAHQTLQAAPSSIWWVAGVRQLLWEYAEPTEEDRAFLYLRAEAAMKSKIEYQRGMLASLTKVGDKQGRMLEASEKDLITFREGMERKKRKQEA